MKRYLLLIVALIGTTLSASAQCPDNEIWYSTVDGQMIEFGNQHGVVSHTYIDANGVIRFDHNIETITSDRAEAGENSISFAGCKNLKNVTLPKGIKEVGYRAFAGCESLQSISIPNRATKIGEDAFDGCIHVMFFCAEGSTAAAYAEARGIVWFPLR